jgi:hypothetical protein
MTTHIEAVKRQKINAANVFLLCFVGFGSMTFGYTASIIGTTLGMNSHEILLFENTEMQELN